MVNLELLTWADYAIIAIVAISVFISLVRGFVREAMSLAVWIIAFWVAMTYSMDLSAKLVDLIEMPSARLGASFAALFVATLVIGALISYLVYQLVDKTGLSGTDRFIGIFFGFGRGVLLIAIVVMFAGLTVIPEDPWWQESQLLGYFEQLAVWLQSYLPPDYAQYFAYQ